MKVFLSVVLASIVLFVVCGCSGSSEQASAEEKKAFAGGPPPKDYMDKVKSFTADAQSKAAKNVPPAGAPSKP